jgi:OOP family OmpA-OmpF porin
MKKKTMRSNALHISIASCLLSVACATPVVTPVEVRPIAPVSGEAVVTDQSILIVDNSRSISRTGQFPDDKALTQSLVAAMPDGRYEAGAIAFGGDEREIHPLAVFDRAALSAWAGNQTYLSGGTPLDEVLTEAGIAREGKREQAAITVVSDGLPTDPETGDARKELTLEVAAKLAKAYPGRLCIHTIQIGTDPAGGAFLEQLSKVTGCGSHRSASSLTTAAFIQAFQREVYLGEIQVAAAPPTDRDGDGVMDGTDECPNTPKGVKPDARGCWVAEHLLFETDSAAIEAAYRERLLSNGVPILEKNPDLRVRIDGHTDSRGEVAHNQKLSERRAEAVRSFFVENGISASRLEARGFGETQPAGPNDTPENLQLNRRVEFTPL